MAPKNRFANRTRRTRPKEAMIERSRRFPRRPPAHQPQPPPHPPLKESIRKTLEKELQFAQQKVAELQEQEQSMKKQKKRSKPKKQQESDEDIEETPLPKRKVARRKSIPPTPPKIVPVSKPPAAKLLARTFEYPNQQQNLEYKILEDLKREIAQEQHDVRKMMNELISQLKHRKYQRLEHERSLKASSEFIYS